MGAFVDFLMLVTFAVFLGLCCVGMVAAGFVLVKMVKEYLKEEGAEDG